MGRNANIEIDRDLLVVCVQKGWARWSKSKRRWFMTPSGSELLMRLVQQELWELRRTGGQKKS